MVVGEAGLRVVTGPEADAGVDVRLPTMGLGGPWSGSDALVCESTGMTDEGP